MMKLYMIISLVSITLASDCVQMKGETNRCRCQTKEGFVVDLSKIPRFKKLKPANDTAEYSLSLCKPIEDEPCKGFSVCQQDKGLAYNAGFPPKENDVDLFKGDPWKDELKLLYQASDGETTRKSHIELKCARNGESAEALGEKEKENYFFKIETEHVCKPSPPKPAKKKGLSVGSILCILLLVLLVVYFVGGFLFLRFARGARGVEQVPNFEFWKEIPLLIWDGAVFLKNGCKTDRTYDQI